MLRTGLIIAAMLILIMPVTAMGSTNFDLSWNVMGGGGGAMTSAAYAIKGTVGQIAGLASSASYKLQAGFWVDEGCGFTVIPLPGYSIPTDPDGDCRYEDLTGNGSATFTDVVLFFDQMEWIVANEPVAAFDFSGNGAITFKDIVLLFEEV